MENSATMYEWFEGRTAWSLGSGSQENPYVGENQRYADWMSGWESASRDYGKGRSNER